MIYSIKEGVFGINCYPLLLNSNVCMRRFDENAEQFDLRWTNQMK